MSLPLEVERKEYKDGGIGGLSVHSSSQTPALALASTPTPQPILNEKVSETAQAILQTLKLGSLDALGQSKKLLGEKITHLSANDLKQVLDAYFEELCQQVQSLDYNQELHQLAEIVPLKDLQNAVKTRYPKHVDALKEAKKMLQKAKCFFEMTECAQSSTLEAKFFAFLDVLMTVVEVLVFAFGMGDFFTPSEDEYDAAQKAQKIFMLVSSYSFLASLFIPILGAATGGLIIGGFLLLTTTLSLVWPNIKPMPFNLPKSENWTKQYHHGNLSALDGREDSINKIASAIIDGEKPMLLGKSGVGKTETIKAFVKAVERGDYEELKGKKVFYINVADLVNDNDIWSGKGVLKKISEAMGRHRDNIILVLDETHLACQKRETAVLGDQLKTLLDKGYEKFPHVISITTEEEFYRDIYSNNYAFARRFKRIIIADTNEKETLDILNNAILQQAPHALVDEGALKYLLTKSSNVSNPVQPAAALRILTECIKRTEEIQKSPKEMKKEQIERDIKSIHAQGAVGQGDSLLSYEDKNEGESKIDAFEKVLESLSKSDIETEKKNLKNLSRSKEILARVKTDTFRTAMHVSNFQNENLTDKDKSQLAEFMLRSHFLAPVMKKHVIEQAEKLNVKMVINQSLINEVIKEEQENDKKAQEAVLRAKNEIDRKANEQ